MDVPFLSALNLLSKKVSEATTPLIKKGSKRDYIYEIWSMPDTNGYYLKVRKGGKYPNTKAPEVVGSFKTPQEAFKYLDSKYR
ncbi:MAG: hypothetical protein IGS39_21865 [Calothrix sp. C42_A2020_038]|nr:hypothetical protein [Calothrix sp. C42_A2020_038]